MATNDCIKTLRQLDRSSPQYLNQLSEALTGMELDGSVPNLEAENVMALIEYLDEVRFPANSSRYPAKILVGPG